MSTAGPGERFRDRGIRNSLRSPAEGRTPGAEAPSQDESSQEIVTAIITLAHGLRMTVVSEGVETAHQHQAVTRLGSDWCQGFYFAKPMLATGIDALIHQPADGNNPHLPAVPTASRSKGENGQTGPARKRNDVDGPARHRPAAKWSRVNPPAAT